MAKTTKTKTRKSSTAKAAKPAAASQEAEILLAAIEGEVAPWQRPWDAEKFEATKPRSWKNRPYHGSNVVGTMFFAYLAAYAASEGKTMGEIEPSVENLKKVYQFGFNAEKVEFRFATFNAIKNDLEGTVKKGAKSCRIKFFRPKTEKELNEKGEEEEKVKGFILARYNIFPLSAAEGINEDKLPKGKFDDVDIRDLSNAKGKEFVKNLKENSELKFSMEGNRAFWQVGTNVVHTPKITQFKSEGYFWGTLLHEIVHWSGDKTRLDRSGFPYEQEELVAELGSWELCRILGVPFDPGEKKAYLKNWLSKFPSREGKLTALDEALKAVDKTVKFLAKTGKLDLSGGSAETAAPAPEIEADSETDLAA